ncbi:fatty acid-binding protein 2, liver-like [Diadema antillarum]|uniref:fatty acid-binding protein 2, liver-like n=1 Tax=Diadema antillarum TaxID=105358 RepID=UPI003A862787
MPADFSGSWTIDHHDDFSAMLEKLQVPADQRPPATISQLDVEIKQDGDNFTITNKSPAGTKEHSFTVGESFKLVMMGNMPEVDVSSSWDGDRLVFTDNRGVKLTREIVDGQIVSTFSMGDSSVKLYFKRV